MKLYHGTFEETLTFDNTTCDLCTTEDLGAAIEYAEDENVFEFNLSSSAKIATVADIDSDLEAYDALDLAATRESLRSKGFDAIIFADYTNSGREIETVRILNSSSLTLVSVSTVGDLDN